MKTTMKDKYGNELNVSKLVVARTALSTNFDEYLTAGTVYPAGFLRNGDIAVIDNDNELVPIKADCVVNLNTSDDWRCVDMAYTKAGFSCGDIVPVKTEIENRHLNQGCVWCLNQSGKWIALPTRSLTKVKVHMSAQALTARMKSAAEVGTSPTILIDLTGIGSGGAADVRSIGGAPSQAFNFIPREIKLDRIVKVEFSKGGKLYTYRLKDDMIAEPGDDAVVIVNNPAYPELKGTKVVRVKEVDIVENLGGSYKYVEHIVSNEDERKAQQEVKRNRAQKRLDKKHAELVASHETMKRIETEYNQLVEDFFNGKY